MLMYMERTNGRQAPWRADVASKRTRLFEALVRKHFFWFNWYLSLNGDVKINDEL